MSTRANILLLALLAIVHTACGGSVGPSSPAADQGKQHEQIESEALRSDTESLQATVASYERIIREQQTSIAQRWKHLQPGEPGALVTQTGDEQSEEEQAAHAQLEELKDRLGIYAAELARRSTE